ncbi:MAG TPA: RDD family protein [Arenimonas sp.]|uniref:RDD family protein n=1 Tax=Arenimonas sp. TaxID=1872635 RepID=UPI002BCFD1E7|nr:RDD family protein [Arenimonas sp.]HMB57800.1 RDD family protein [Arenimonas sp.]
MSASLWYYVDSQQQRVGPVPAEELRSAYREGRITGDSLVWRDGMAQWQPLRQFEIEFDLEDEPAILQAPPPTIVTPVAVSTDASPYAPPQAPVAMATYFNANATDIVYAGFWRRFAAWFVDATLVTIVYYAIFFAIMMIAGVGLRGFEPGADPAAMQPMMMVVILMGYVVYPIISSLYFVFQESSEAQATLGKRLLGIKVTDLDGQRLSRGRALGRWASHIVSLLTMYIGYIVAAFTERKQGLHDMVASTLVVDEWAFTDQPDKQKRELGGCLITFIVVIAILPVVLIGVFVAVLIPLMQGLGGIH